MIKNLISVIILFILSLAGCGGSDSGGSTPITIDPSITNVRDSMQSTFYPNGCLADHNASFVRDYSTQSVSARNIIWNLQNGESLTQYLPWNSNLGCYSSEVTRYIIDSEWRIFDVDDIPSYQV